MNQPIAFRELPLTLKSDGRSLQIAICEALERIDDDVRAAFVLCDLAELPAKETATLLQTSPREIRQRVHRARLMLIGALDGFFQGLHA
jgi:RNA polymerase sigma factor (sigma-70 family)